MSTFTVGIVVSEFNYVRLNKTECGIDLGTEVKVWARMDFLPALENVSCKIVKSVAALEEFWGVPYTLPKLDFLALPNYQATKPADNWGLILFKYVYYEKGLFENTCYY